MLAILIVVVSLLAIAFVSFVIIYCMLLSQELKKQRVNTTSETVQQSSYNAIYVPCTRVSKRMFRRSRFVYRSRRRISLPKTRSEMRSLYTQKSGAPKRISYNIVIDSKSVRVNYVNSNSETMPDIKFIPTKNVRDDKYGIAA